MRASSSAISRRRRKLTSSTGKTYWSFFVFHRSWRSKQCARKVPSLRLVLARLVKNFCALSYPLNPPPGTGSKKQTAMHPRFARPCRSILSWFRYRYPNRVNKGDNLRTRPRAPICVRLRKRVFAVSHPGRLRFSRIAANSPDHLRPARSLDFRPGGNREPCKPFTSGAHIVPTSTV
jgi:hypothetical protein